MVEDPRLVSLYDDWQARKRFTDALASELGVQPWEVTVYVGRDRGEKNIHLPFYGKQAAPASALFRDRSGRQRLAVCAHHRCRELHGTTANGRVPAVAQAIAGLLADLPSAQQSGHIFF